MVAAAKLAGQVTLQAATAALADVLADVLAAALTDARIGPFSKALRVAFTTSSISSEVMPK